MEQTTTSTATAEIPATEQQQEPLTQDELMEARRIKLLQPLENSILPPEKLAFVREIIEKDKAIKPFWVNKYKNEAAKNWDRFYKRNETRFYKDRHWIEREFTVYKGNGTTTDDNGTEIPARMNCLE
ncbi:hypothetical protein BGZ46_004814, partial [Entomortierella lignicola]